MCNVGKKMFVFYSKSADKDPGSGTNEKVPFGDFTNLKNVKDWRKKLSNFWVQEFDVGGKKWKSVEHYYQAHKFKNGNNALFERIRLCETPNEAKKLGGKKNKCDDDFFSSGRCDEEMYTAQYAKFSQNEDLKQILIASGDVELWHYMRGGKLIRFNGLEKVRIEFHS